MIPAYHIRRLGALWAIVAIDGATLFRSIDRNRLIAEARELARPDDGQVHVYDCDGGLEVVYAFNDGIESVERHIRPRLSHD